MSRTDTPSSRTRPMNSCPSPIVTSATPASQDSISMNSLYYNSSRSPSPQGNGHTRTHSGNFTSVKEDLLQVGNVAGGGRKKRRGLLKQFYGDSSGTAAGKTKSRIDPLDVDGPDFDPDMYLKKIFYESSVANLVDTENMFVNEIRTLDSDVQTLVYENYNKFISATDTIRQMKGKFESMESEMVNVQNNMNSIMVLRETIHSTLDTNRRSLSQLSGVHLLLKKLQFLFELPSRLKRCVEIKAYRQAVRYYSKSHAILGRYEHLPSFQGIRSECIASMNELIDLLQERLNDPRSISLAELAEAFELLVVLEEETPADLSTRFLECTEAWLAVYVRTMEAKQAALNSSDDIGKPEEFLDFCNTRYLHAVKEFIRVYIKVFLRHVDANLYGGNGKGEMERQSSVAEDSTSRTSLNTDMEVASVVEKKKLRTKLIGGIQSHVTKYLELVRRMFQGESHISDEVYVVCVNRLYLHAGEVDAVFPDAAVRKLTEKYLYVVLESRMHLLRVEFLQLLEYHIVDLCEQIAPPAIDDDDGDEDRRNDKGPEVKSDMNAILQQSTAAVFQKIVERLIARASVFISDSINLGPQKSWRSSFVQKYVYNGVLIAMLHHTPLYLMKLCGAESATSIDQPFVSTYGKNNNVSINPVGGQSSAGIDNSESLLTCESLFSVSDLVNQWHDDPQPPETALMLSKLCHTIASTHIPVIIAQFITGMSSVKVKEDKIETKLLEDESQIAAEALLKRHVHLQGVVLSKLILKSVSTRDWLGGSEPRMVRAAIRKCVDEFAKMEVVASSYYEYDVEELSGARVIENNRRLSLQRSGKLSAGVDNNLMANIQRLFAERIVIFGDVDFTTPSIMTAVLKIVLKAFQEGVRVKTFGRFGYNQLEVDILYLKNNLWRPYIDEDMSEHMYAEILSSASRRCLNLVPMNVQVAAAITRG
eukprot:CFRG1019T1